MRDPYAGIPAADEIDSADEKARTGLVKWRAWLSEKLAPDRSHVERMLERTVADLNTRQRDMIFLGEMAQLLQACRTLDEVCKVARNRLETLSPRLSGALYLSNEAGGYLENPMAWGTIEVSNLSFAPGDCWSLRCGRPHQVSRGQDAITCTHIAPGEGEWSLCVPLVAQGETLGILHFRVDAKRARRAGVDQPLAGDRLHFYLNVAETLSLAVANIRLRDSLQQQAIRDPLTGLFNRRYFQETLRRELHRASRADHPLAVVLFDIDHFKRFNDTFGHDAGDAALKAIGEILLSRTRAGDVACRHGGEEFALAFPGLSTSVAASRVEDLRREIEGREIQYLGQIIGPVTISAGVAVYPNHASDIDSLMRLADQALYKSKEGGRNRYTMATAPRRSSETSAALSLVHSAE